MSGIQKKIRVGVLIDSFQIPAWSYKMLELIQNGGAAEIVLLIKNESSSAPVSESGSIFQNSDTLLYKIYRKLDRKLFKANPDAFKRMDVDRLLADIPVIKTIPRKTKFSDYIPDEDLAEIRDYDVDVLIRMGFRILRGDILKVARYGIWSYHHGDNAVNRGGPPGFWEVMNNEDATGVVLQILTEDLDGGLNLFKSFSLTDHISVNRNTNNYYWKALSFLPDKLNELKKSGPEFFFKNVRENNKELLFYDKPLYKNPGNLKMLGLLWKKFQIVLSNKWNDIFKYDQWILLYKISKKAEVSTAFYQFNRIIPPKDRIWADPFIVYRNNKYYIFIEELLYSTNKGHIAVIEMDEMGNYEKPFPVLEKDYHLSYPNIFELEGTLYMIPETKENKTIELYRCVNFPDNWKFESNLMENISAVDTTIYFKDRFYWMFTNIRRNEGASSHDELFLYYSEDLFSGNWKYHPKNPIISDVRKARPAGKIFEHEGTIYRPSQDCSRHYGYGLNLNKIEILNSEDYKEVLVDKALPDWDADLKGIHTFNNERNLTFSDAIYRRNKMF